MKTLSFIQFIIAFLMASASFATTQDSTACESWYCHSIDDPPFSRISTGMGCTKKQAMKMALRTCKRFSTKGHTCEVMSCDIAQELYSSDPDKYW